MNNFISCSPTRFAFGRDREQDVGARMKRFGGTKVLTLCRGNGRQGNLTGFTALNEEHCANIYRLML